MSDQATLQTKSSEIYLRLLGYIRPHLKVLLIGMVGFMVYAACDSAFAWWMQQLVDNIQASASSQRWYLAGLIIGIYFARGLSGTIGSYCTEYVARQLINAIRRELFAHILRLPCQYYEQYSSGSVLSKLIYNVENVASAATNALRILFRGGLTVIGLFGFMLYTNWKLSLLFLITMPIMAAIIWFVSKRFRNISHQIQNAISNVSERASEVLRGYQVVKIFEGAKQENKAFGDIIERDRHQRLKLTLTSEVSSNLIQMIFALTLAVLILLAMSPQILTSLSTGEFVAFVTAAGFISRPLLQLTQVNAMIQQGIAAADSIFEVLDIAPEADTGRIELNQCRGEIRFDKVSFRYPESTDWVLKDISFNIPAGSTYALVGRSGSGKSTLAAMVARFYEANQGAISLDGVLLSDIKLSNLRQHIALVNQNISLFNASVSQNIGYGAMADFSPKKIHAAAEHAQVMEFVKKMPQGLDTQIGESGVTLSGGQRQRLAIARAFLKDAPILILDEATSALDTRSELLIQRAIGKLMKNRTSLIIAHRLSTIENADKIMVLDNGHIVESGSHKELLKKNGEYVKLLKQQAD